MNLLTDIIRDVAGEMGIRDLTNREEMELQKDALNSIVQRVAWIKQERVKKTPFPWLEQEPPIQHHQAVGVGSHNPEDEVPF